MTERYTGPIANHWGTFYPTGYVVAVLPDGQAAERAAQALRDGGHGPDDVRIFSGEEVQEIDRRFQHDRSVAQRIASRGRSLRMRLKRRSSTWRRLPAAGPSSPSTPRT
jgi:hypothetical protein